MYIKLLIYNISTHQHTRANTIEMMMTITAPVDDTPTIITIVPKTTALYY